MDLGKMWELKKMYDKYRELQKALKNLVIRAKEGEYTDENWEKAASVLVDMTGEMKLKDFKINDTSLLDLSKKEVLEDLVLKAFGWYALRRKRIRNPSDSRSLRGWYGVVRFGLGILKF